MEGAVRVVVGDAQFLFADGLATCLEGAGGLEVCERRPTSGIDLLEVFERDEPGVVVVDYWLRDFEGPVTTRLLLSRRPDTKVIMLSWFHGPAHVRAALSAGAVGFLPKSVTYDRVVETVVCVHAGEYPILAERFDGLNDPTGYLGLFVPPRRDGLAGLTVQELRVLRLLAEGMTVDDVADRLGISLGTVRTHVHKILGKAGAQSQLEAVATARECGLVP
jgi:two-component system NarL family response regulator